MLSRYFATISVASYIYIYIFRGFFSKANFIFLLFKSISNNNKQISKTSTKLYTRFSRTQTYTLFNPYSTIVSLLYHLKTSEIRKPWFSDVFRENICWKWVKQKGTLILISFLETWPGRCFRIFQNILVVMYKNSFP